MSGENTISVYNDCLNSVNLLITKAEKMLRSGNFCISQPNENTRIEKANGANLHRGYYCPSPVCDLVIGNTHRGKILTRPNLRSKIQHSFYFGKDGRLQYVKQGAMEEFLIYEEGQRNGYTIRKDGLTEISKETFDDGKITSYLFAYVSPGYLKEGKLLGFVRHETYHYKNGDISECTLFETVFGKPKTTMHISYAFHYESGKIYSYSKVYEDGSHGSPMPVYGTPRDVRNFCSEDFLFKGSKSK